MLVLGRRIGERILIGDDIVIVVTDINFASGRVSLGIEAPKETAILRDNAVLRNGTYQPREQEEGPRD